jgi:hypothetical protein
MPQNYKFRQNQENAYGSGSGTSTSQTQLARRLNLPLLPKPKPGLSYAIPTTLAVFGFVGACFFVAMLLNGEISFFGLIIYGAIEIGLILVAVTQYQKIKKSEAIVDVEQRKLSAKWVELYYYYRDDCVFDPRTNKHTSPEGISRLL